MMTMTIGATTIMTMTMTMGRMIMWIITTIITMMITEFRAGVHGHWHRRHGSCGESGAGFERRCGIMNNQMKYECRRVRILKGAVLALATAAMAVTLTGCLSVHVHKDTEPAPVIVVPNDHPTP